ncbi:MAG: acyl-CoA dehydrogenase [Candidatus Puniceispirillum sp. TMED52]|nr:acyl-CoA dehydrogenase [SAR116 cluster bacterium]OUU45988.1 MAG: acyl-CoA dehydrogenase [Candidatus Puniceispirillum sp. TMED52]
MYHAPLKDIQFVFRHLIDRANLAEKMDHEALTDDLSDAIFDEAAKFASDIIAPTNAGGDKGSARLDDGSVVTPPGFKAAYAAMGEAGWTAMDASEEYGGQAMPMAVSAFVNEMWQAANMSFALCHLLTQGQIYALEKYASPEHKSQFIQPMVEGRWTGTMNLTEPQAGTDLAAIRSMAIPEGDHYRISGQKIYITYGEHDMAENIVHLLLARTPDAPAGHKGISVFLVPKFLINADGSIGERNDVKCVSIEKKLGIKGSPTAVLQYGDEGGAVGYLVGELNKGLEIMFAMMNHARFMVGLQGLAISERAYQQAVSYAMDRKQGTPLGGTEGDPIIGHPDVLRLMASMRSDIMAMRGLLGIGAAAMDLATHDGGQDHQDRLGLLVPIIKGWLTELSLEITSQAIQVHGGMGFIEETGAAQHYRDARILPIYEGTTAIQANDLVFRKTLRDGGASVMALLDDITADMNAITPEHDDEAAAQIAAMAARVIHATDNARHAIQHLLAAANSPRKAAASGHHFVMMMGMLTGGWQMVRGAAIARKQSQTDGADVNFLSTRWTLADVFITQRMPQVDALAETIMKGDEAVLAIAADMLAVQ